MLLDRIPYKASSQFVWLPEGSGTMLLGLKADLHSLSIGHECVTVEMWAPCALSAPGADAHPQRATTHTMNLGCCRYACRARE